MRSRLMWTAVASVALLGGGCGTAANTVWLAPFEGGQRVYGGVRADVDVMRTTAAGEFGVWVGGEQVKSKPRERIGKLLLLTLDLPLSAIGDTLTLPYTLAVGVRRCIAEYYFPPTPAESPPPAPAPAEPLPEKNALAPFVGNVFDAWNTGKRVELPKTAELVGNRPVE